MPNEMNEETQNAIEKIVNVYIFMYKNKLLKNIKKY